MTALISRRFTCVATVSMALVGLMTTKVLAVGAAVVDAGYNLLNTQPGSNFVGTPLQGVPLGTYNFGGSIGNQSVGDADTIVQRLSNATALLPLPKTADPVSIQLDALQMVSTTPVDLGAGVNFYYVTLQSIRGGPASTGQMTIEFNNSNSGTFSSSFDVFYDIRLGSLNGPIVLSSDTLLSNPTDAWQNTPPDANDVVITGVNSMLNGASTNNDFWPIGNITHSGTGASHVVRNAEQLPEPGSLLMLSVAGLLLWRRSH